MEHPVQLIGTVGVKITVLLSSGNSCQSLGAGGWAVDNSTGKDITGSLSKDASIRYLLSASG